MFTGPIHQDTTDIKHSTQDTDIPQDTDLDSLDETFMLLFANSFQHPECMY